ncbi:MAG: hypothetical protein FWE77_02195 [Clostridia bacterium]|nr:hypothetical protein [Clostridia bacterium]
MKKVFARALILLLILALPFPAVAGEGAPLSMTAQEWTCGFLGAAQAMGLPLEEEEFVYERGATGQHGYTLTIAQAPDHAVSLGVFSEDGTAISICSLRLVSAVLGPDELAQAVSVFAHASRAMVMASDPDATADDADAVGPALYADLPAALLRGVRVDSTHTLRGVRYSLWMGFEPESFFGDAPVPSDGYVMDFTVRAGDTEEGEDGPFDCGELFLEDYCWIENWTDGAHYILPATEGFICDIVYVGGWTLTMGNAGADGRIERGILGQADLGREGRAMLEAEDDNLVVLEGDNPVGIVPCGEDFVYFGGGGDSTGSWMIRKPGEEPRVLPLTWRDDVFAGNANGIWYTTAVDESRADLYFMGLDGSGKQKLGSVQGNTVGVLADSSIVLIDFDENTVPAWKANESTVLYSSEEPLLTAAATPDSVWVIFADHFGRVVDGELRDRQEGYAMLMGRSGYQLVFLVMERPGESEARVVLVNDITRSIEELGRVPYSHYSSHVELRENAVIVWGEETRVLPIPVGHSMSEVDEIR